MTPDGGPPSLGHAQSAEDSQLLAHRLSCNHPRFIYAGSHVMHRGCWLPVFDADAPDLQAAGDGYPTHGRTVSDAEVARPQCGSDSPTPEITGPVASRPESSALTRAASLTMTARPT